MYHGGEVRRKINPILKSNIISRITFFFTIDLLKKGFKKDISEDDIYEIIPQLKSEQIGDDIEREWLLIKKQKTGTSIYRLLWNCYSKYYLLLGFLQLIVKISMILVLPQVQGRLVSYFNPKSELTRNDAIFYGCLLITLCIFRTTYNHNYRFFVTELGIKMKSALCSLLYRKSLRLPPSSLSQNGIGKIVTLLSKDVNSFPNAIIFLNDIWISIIILIVAFTIMYKKIGVSAFAGAALLILIIPVQVLLGCQTTQYRLDAAKATDKRLQQTQEVLSFIKIIKMNTWEDIFVRKILKLRKTEMKKIRMFYFARAIFTEIGPFVITITWYIFITTYTQLGNILTAEIAFFLRACLSALRSPVTISIPLGILRSAEMIASVKRIHSVLTADEYQDNKKENNPPLIRLNQVNVSILKDINLEIDSGLNLISGKCGSGKSILLKTILGDFPLCQGNLQVFGRISYAPQEPWLFPSTIKQNILFGQEFNQERYNKVIEICALKSDLDSFKNGDETIVDDRGRNLSKGQQVRIGLARVVYCDSDIYLIDDCLNHLDVQLQKYIFWKCLQSFLKNKIVVMVSNNQEFFQTVDNIFIMESGTVKTSYKSLKIPEKSDVSKENIELGSVNIKNEDILNESSKLLQSEIFQNIYHEEVKEGKVVLKVYKKYFMCGGGMLILIWILLLYAATQIAISYSEKSVSDWVNIQKNISECSTNATNTTDFENLLKINQSIFNFYSISIAIALVFLLLRIYGHFNFATRASTILHRSMISSVVNATMEFFDTKYFGNILNRFSKDLYSIDEILPFNIDECLKFLCRMVGIMVLIIFVNINFFIPGIIFLNLLLLLRRLYIPTGRSLKRLESATRSPVIGHLNATLEGLSIIKASKTEDILKKEFDKYQDLYISAEYMEQSASRAFAFALDMLSNIFTATVIITLLIIDKGIGAGNVGLAITQAMMLHGALQWGIRQWSDLENHMTSVERVLEYTKANQENKDKYFENSVTFKQNGEIIYENVCLKYNKSKENVLKNLNLFIKSGEKIGIVGRTGAGKSSFVSLLFLLYPYEGLIEINNADIKTIPLSLLRSNISIISEDPFVYKGSIRDNIDPTGQYTDEDIWSAVDKTNMKELIPSLDFEIDNSSNLSCGQKQLLCLTRALVSKSKIIILDEASANVDSDTNSLINKIIHEDFKHRTVLIITHRFDNILDCDKVMVFDNGKVVEFDNPEVLLTNKNSIFYTMYT